MSKRVPNIFPYSKFRTKVLLFENHNGINLFPNFRHNREKEGAFYPTVGLLRGAFLNHTFWGKSSSKESFMRVLGTTI